jgi:hypothetical protein
VAFHSHPTQAFHIVVVEGDEKLAADIYDAFVDNGLAQHSFAGGFDEAISELEVGELPAPTM